MYFHYFYVQICKFNAFIKSKETLNNKRNFKKKTQKRHQKNIKTNAH